MTPSSQSGPSAAAASAGLGADVTASDLPTGTIPAYNPGFHEPASFGSSGSGHTAPPPPFSSQQQPPPFSSQQGQQPTTQPGAGAGAPPRQAARPRGPRRAQLQLRHINPWTVLKFTCVLSIALFFVWLIVVGVLYGVLDAAGVVDKINHAVTTINGTGSSPPVTAGIVFGGAAIIGVINMILFIALSTVGSVVYNLCADLVGGIEITLSES